MLLQAPTLAQRFHALYEHLAPFHGYETRTESAKPWEEVPEHNKALMVEVCSGILTQLRPYLVDRDEVEATAMKLHEQRHRFGGAQVCDSCRKDALYQHVYPTS